MKRILIIGAILVPILFSCYFSSDGSVGSLTIPLQGTAKGIVEPEPYNTARVYFMSANTALENAFYDLGDGQIYAQVAVENGTVTVEGAPVGNWNILLALGSLEGPGVFYVQQYGESGAVQILPDVTNEVSVAPLNANPFKTAAELFGKEVAGVAEFGSSLYAAEPGSLHSYDGPGFLGYDDQPDPAAGQTINSLSPGLDASGNPVLYINTDQGIFLPGTPYTEFSSGLGEVSVLDSGAYTDGVNTIVYFQRDGGLGGALFPTPAEWIDVDLSEYITGQPVLDFEIVEDLDCAFFVTKLGAFVLNADLLEGEYDAEDVFELAKFFNTIEETFYSIQSIGYTPAGGGQMYLGTDSGAYVGVPSAPPADTFTSVSAVPGTVGRAIDKVEVSTSGYVAFLSNLNLYVTDGIAAPVKIPFYGGLPGTVRDMAWHSSNVLIIAGTTGLVSVDPAALGLVD